MAEPLSGDRIPVTLLLPQDLALRLKAAAEARQQSAGEFVIDLLDRNLPRLGGPKKQIPYA